MALNVEDVLRIFSLVPLPGEGGYFRETYRSQLVIPKEALPPVYTGPRYVGTAIYYLLTPNTSSLIHRLPGDEVFHFYLGDPVEMLQIHPNGKAYSVVIGSDIERDMQPQVVVPAGVWQGSRLVPGGRFALLGTTMAPGFEFGDFEPGNQTVLLRQFPEYADLIRALTMKD
jgi:predicted cupin superfamily sugar epimerase